MEKTATLKLRVNPEVKRKAEEVLNALGVPMSTAIDMYLKQISLTGGIPFPITLPTPPKEINADLMTKDEIIAKIKQGVEDIENGRTYNGDILNKIK
ncbi:MAG: type II toxin-antitoxin system RelB/DinJ family antitoxin [Ruminococcus sp.]|nr:type II toxin-antitoxin system RelB/DinJ family antitoxin [Ruminococcus sp.]